MVVYELRKIDLTSVGSVDSNPKTVWRKLFDGDRKAMVWAESDNASNAGFRTVTWTITDHGLTSNDLFTHMYEIEPLEVH